jgi:hypothetical protein
MALTVKLWTRMEIVDGNGTVRASDGLTPYDPPKIVTAASGVVHDQSHSVLTTATAEIFDVADDISDFDFLWIKADQDDVLIQLVIDDNATNGESYQVVELTKNVPFILASDDALASNGAVDVFTGTADVIERVNVKNNNASTTIVRVVAVT